MHLTAVIRPQARGARHCLRVKVALGRATALLRCRDACFREECESDGDGVDDCCSSSQGGTSGSTIEAPALGRERASQCDVKRSFWTVTLVPFDPLPAAAQRW